MNWFGWFGTYAARQLGLDRRFCPQLCKLASEYIRKCEGIDDDIYSYFANEPEADSLLVKLVEEFERCILSYFAFHWSHADITISQVGTQTQSLWLPQFLHAMLIPSQTIINSKL